MSILQVNEQGKTLYAICTEKTNRHGQIVDTQIVYVHASNEGEARWLFGQDPDFKTYKAVAVAPAVGFYVADNHGDQLIA